MTLILRTACRPALPILALPILVLLAGCEVGPDFQRPNAPKDAGYTKEQLQPQTVGTAVAGGEAQHFVPGGDLSVGGVSLVEVAGRWRFQTADDLAFLMTLEREEPRRLSRAAQETLAIVAYHQPVTRAEIEAIRGVQASRGTLDVLLEIGFVRPRGRRRTPGRPVTYATTDVFLEHFGLASLADLPGAAEMKAAGLLDLDLPPDFAVPDPSAAAPDDDPLEDEAPGEFHTDYLGPETPEI